MFYFYTCYYCQNDLCISIIIVRIICVYKNVSCYRKWEFQYPYCQKVTKTINKKTELKKFKRLKNYNPEKKG